MITYLCSPYSSPDAAVREMRFRAACRAAAELIAEGDTVFCPIAHSHSIAVHGGVDALDGDVWLSQDLAIAAALADARLEPLRLMVLMLDGWRESVGIQRELDWASAHDIQVEAMEPDSLPDEDGMQETLECVAAAAIRAVLPIGASKHPPWSYRAEPLLEHLLKGARHGMTALGIAEEVVPPDGDDHISAMAVRALMALDGRRPA